MQWAAESKNLQESKQISKTSKPSGSWIKFKQAPQAGGCASDQLIYCLSIDNLLNSWRKTTTWPELDYSDFYRPSTDFILTSIYFY